MKSKTTIETTIEVSLNAQDILAFVKEKELAPTDWNFYSVEVVGAEASMGGKLIIHHTESPNS